MTAKSAAAQLREELATIKNDQAQLTTVLGTLAEQVGELSKYIAKNNPVIISERDESEDHQIGHERPRAMKSDGDAKDSLEKRVIEQVDGPRLSAKAEEMAFMEEELEVMVADTTNPNEVRVPCVWNNGVAQYFIRNQKQKVKRKYVEVLGRLKRTTYTQQLVKDGNGNETYINVPHTALMYPLAILGDPSGQRGRDWWDRVLKENT